MQSFGHNQGPFRILRQCLTILAYRTLQLYYTLIVRIKTRTNPQKDQLSIIGLVSL